MQLTVHGSHKLIAREYTDGDLPMLIQFCTECKELGYENNSSLEAIKLDKMTMPYGKFFIALDGDRIVSIAGVHKLPEVHEHAYRCLFRGAQLNGYTPKFSMNMFTSGIHYTYFLYLQINYILSVDENAEFFISTNINSDTGACSSRINAIMMPKMEKLGIWRLYEENMLLYNTMQNIWQINTETYMNARAQWLVHQNALGLR